MSDDARWPEGIGWWEPVHPGWHWRNTMNWRGLSQREVAASLHTSEKHISQIVRQRIIPSADLTVRFSRLCGLDPQVMWLATCRWEYEQALAAERERTPPHRSSETSSAHHLKP